MNTRPATTRSRTRRRPRAKKSLGQHFLQDQEVVREIADALELDRSSTVIEIGAGQGILTRELGSRAKRVVAVELDDALADQLRREFAGTNVGVIHADALQIEPTNLLSSGEPYSLAGNLPYNVAQPLLRHFLEATSAPTQMVVMIQDEVAESIVANPGKMSLLSVAVQLYGDPELLFRVPPSAFQPPPKVTSAVVRIDVALQMRANVTDIEAFFRVVRAGFSSRRKQLRNSLANGLSVNPTDAEALLVKANIDPSLRPQALSLDQWASLCQAWLETMTEPASP